MNPSSANSLCQPAIGVSTFRAGSALVMAMITVVALAGMAFALTELSMGTFTSQKRNQDQVALLASAESGINEAIDWLQNGTAWQQPDGSWSQNGPTGTQLLNVSAGGAMQQLLVYPADPMNPSSIMLYNPTAPYVAAAPPAGTRGRYVLTYAVPAIGTDPANRAGYRNGNQITIEIIKLRGTAAGNSWTDGNEKYQIYATAQAGDLTLHANGYRRLRVDAIISTSSGSNIFMGSMYAYQGYAFKGAATSDSWSGLGAGGTPVAYPGLGTTANGNLYSGGTVTIAKPGSVQGSAYSNVALVAPVQTYTPAPTVSAGAAPSPLILTGPTTVHYSSSSGGIQIAGTGQVAIYVDGDLSLSTLNFPSGNASVVIYQGNSASSLNISNNGIGDMADPRRLTLISNFSGSATMNGNGTFSGVIFAPFANFKLNGTFTYYGSLIAQSFWNAMVMGTFKFHYDDLLKGFSLPISPRLTATGWWPHTLIVGQP